MYIDNVESGFSSKAHPINLPYDILAGDKFSQFTYLLVTWLGRLLLSFAIPITLKVKKFEFSFLNVNILVYVYLLQLFLLL